MEVIPPTEQDPQRSHSITPEQRVEALRHVNKRRGLGLGFLWEWTKIFWISVALFLVLRTFIVEAFKIPSGSMEHTLLIGDFLLVNKLAYGAEIPFTHRRLPRIAEPQRGSHGFVHRPAVVRSLAVSWPGGASATASSSVKHSRHSCGGRTFPSGPTWSSPQ